jgi:hypothetical protein
LQRELDEPVEQLIDAEFGKINGSHLRTPYFLMIASPTEPLVSNPLSAR